MKNIIVIGIPQSGLYDYVSLLELNYAREREYGLLGGLFNSFGDAYRKDVKNTQATSLSQPHFAPGAHRRTFGLNKEGKLVSFRDYGQGSFTFNSVSELKNRINLLKKAKGHYLMALTTWDLKNISENAPELLGEVKEILNKAEVVIVKPSNLEDTAASYLLANETGGWVVPKTNKPIALNSKFNVNADHLESFAKELSLLKDISKEISHAEVVDAESALRGGGLLNKIGISNFEPATFGRPVYTEKSVSYFKDAKKIREFVGKLS